MGGTLDASSFDPELDYFRQRYFANGAFTYHFDQLHLRKNDQEALVRAAINGSDNDFCNRVAAVLIIIFRYRNNLFQDVKRQYKIADQLGSFTAAGVKWASGVLSRSSFGSTIEQLPGLAPPF